MHDDLPESIVLSLGLLEHFQNNLLEFRELFIAVAGSLRSLHVLFSLFHNLM